MRMKSSQYLSTTALECDQENYVEIEGIRIYLACPDSPPNVRWIGQQSVLDQVLAAWIVIHKEDSPLHPRLIGKPGVGKTTLACVAAMTMNLPLYIFQCTVDTRPEDILITPVIDKGGNIRYVASPLVSAMIRGGAIILDEGSRMSEKAWASLAPLLDGRRYIESIIAGLKIHAHPSFRLAVTTNDDASTFELPEYILSRLKPEIYVDFPDAEEERGILKENLPFAENDVIEYVVQFLQKAHLKNAQYTVRDGINIARYALKRLSIQNKSKIVTQDEKESLIRQAITMTLGDNAIIDYMP